MQSKTYPNTTVLIITAWLSILLVSELPDILFNLFSGQVPGWLLPGTAVFLVLFLVLYIFLLNPCSHLSDVVT